MHSRVVAVRASVSFADAFNLKAYFHDASERASKVDGFLGGRLYVNGADRADHLILWHYSNVDSAETGLAEIAKGPALPQRQVSGRSPADVMRAKVLSTVRPLRDGLPDGPYLSVSIRVADPGFGVRLAEELEGIFAELDLLPGCLGSAVAANETLEEEVLGMVWWANPAAFQQSIPPGVLYEVQLFNKIA